MIIELSNQNEIHFSYLEQINEIEKEIFLSSGYNLNQLDSMLKDERYSFITFNDKEKVLAYMIYLDCVDCIEILKIAVKKNFRNRDIASSLIEKIKDRDIFIEVRASNFVAINFYKKNKFKQVNVRKNYYSNEEDAIIMKKDGGYDES